MLRFSAAAASAALCLSGCGGSDLPRASEAPPARRSEPALARPTPAPGAEEPRTEAPPAPLRPHDDEAFEREYRSQRALKVFRGEATFYGSSFEGRRTASGEPFDPEAFTAAHRTLPFGTVVRVVCPSSRRVVYVTITDRGPFGSRRRVIDLSRAAAERLDIVRRGVADVRVEVVEYGKETGRRAKRKKKK
jgi:rare lipoprotein A